MNKLVSITLMLLFVLLLLLFNTANSPIQKEGQKMSKNAISIEFPLRGEWFTETSPATRTPSHGTNRFGLRYAFDFIQVDWTNPKLSTHDATSATYFTTGIPLERYYCYGEPVYAPFLGEVVAVENSALNGKKASWIKDQTSAIRNSLFFDPRRDGFKSIGGNYVILKKEEGIYAAFCHLQKDSIAVKTGEIVPVGRLIGNVGHTGNSTEPHLHFHLMTSENLETAEGLPFVFEEYETYDGEKWQTVTNSLPAEKERVRFLK